jgi:hypothetical protein
MLLATQAKGKARPPCLNPPQADDGGQTSPLVFAGVSSE